MTNEEIIKELALYLPEAIKKIGEQIEANGCGDCTFWGREEWEEPCRRCERNCKDYWRKSETKADIPIAVLEQEPCEDCISRKAVRDAIFAECSSIKLDIDFAKVLLLQRAIKDLPPVVTPQEPKIGCCKDCKQWKDSDGVYRRGIGAESQCPINRREVFEGNGYCFLFEKKESKDKE